ncbi:M48 family metallopeptidase [Desulfosporosinus sp. BICA1-9]|uniref:M48 family metallopeptidase n=1 Tax=Desulfosporosinus sp. BICA1-9 TaxID=1531958 RepID=UPI00054BDEEB|nr:SprT family zinc-dependent metalloprotease [Desulfosporosinus sp. BICA1-9]KJS46128.1 MAG: metal-dependent hydrolase [Peptococcaceae bacterium BRH_c23]KJS83720.1 MAG: metal-dependent hydrolase [Desulfosporosinus sp. BICA1-9]HBW33933.1 M48 family peptidase [Desulfosporosinus sp.]
MDQLSIKDQTIPYEERRSARYRRITLSILEDRLRISAPKNVSVKQLQELLLAKQEWILKHWLAKQAVLKRPARYSDGEHFLYRGKTVELKIRRHPRQRIRVYLEGQELEVYLSQDLEDKDCAPHVQKALLSWYKAQARRVLQDKLEKQAERMQVCFQTFRLKEQKTSWGSCSSKRNVNLNWRIIMAPDAGIDYIIIHELAHLTHLNHSEQFWLRVAVFMPEYAYWKKWFKDHGQELRL